MNFQELKEIALKNPKGKIVSRDAAGHDGVNSGSWNRTDCTLDVIEDIKQGLRRLNNIPRVMMMHPATYSNLVGAISFEELYQLGAVFGCAPHDRSWLDVKDDYAEGEVLIIARAQEPYLARGPDPAIVYIDTR